MLFSSDNSSINEKLNRLQNTYEEKKRKIAELMEVKENNERIINTIVKTSPDPVIIAELNFNLAEKRLRKENIRRARNLQIEKQQLLRNRIERLECDMEEAIQMYQETTKDIPRKLRALTQHEQVLIEYANQLRERYEMLRENNHSILQVIYAEEQEHLNATNSTTLSSKSAKSNADGSTNNNKNNSSNTSSGGGADREKEWLRKVVSAAKVLRIKEEEKLEQLKQKYQAGNS